MHRIPSPAVLLLAAVLAPTCAQEDAPAADFIISHDSVTPVANTGPPARGEQERVMRSLGPHPACRKTDPPGSVHRARRKTLGRG